MCTIIAAYGLLDAAPLVIAANRDERYARPTAVGQLLGLRPRVVGGRDLERGGTWMGLNEHGLFVGLTNLGPTRPGRRSRGELVLAALAERDAAAVGRLLEREARGAAFSPFNLLYGDAEQLHVAHVPDDGLTIEPLARGLHVVPSGAVPNAAHVRRVARARALFAERVRREADESELTAALLGVLADTELPHDADDLDERQRRLQALWVRTPDYGTRSSTIALLGNGRPRYTLIEGDPERGPVGPRRELATLLAAPSIQDLAS